MKHHIVSEFRSNDGRHFIDIHTTWDVGPATWDGSSALDMAALQFPGVERATRMSQYHVNIKVAKLFENQMASIAQQAIDVLKAVLPENTEILEFGAADTVRQIYNIALDAIHRSSEYAEALERIAGKAAHLLTTKGQGQ